MNTNNKIASKTMAIKARVYNQIRTDLYKKHLTSNYLVTYKKEHLLTETEKLELFKE